MSLVQANKSKSRKIRLDEIGLYHVLIVRRIHVDGEKRYKEVKDVQKFDNKGLQQFKAYIESGASGIDETEVLHDPTYQKEFEAKIARVKAAENKKLAELQKLEETKKAKGDAKK